MLKKFTFGITICYTVVLTIASLIHISGIPNINYSNTDKILHFIAYSALSWFWFQTFHIKFNWPFNKALVVAAIVSVIFGILIEALQGMLTNTRVADNNDILANTLGVGITIVFLLLLKKTKVKK
ncbi:VanZ family protein [Oceanihabitans sp. 2_MG-2023]|uniref:VanZ family protein n=1 Tax=Oceanihabitans sp. 2_MG-2023 TaxID=3062661 RepID=UPI0026E35D9B|nr:VanZ family protein [Oceanihabitans sp. 2_MG-2023]MDO6596355.1 VanZ family protein [Oceanihabitans sp. 2_MG-2023]